MIDLLPYDKSHLDLFVPNEADLARYGDINSEMFNPLGDHGICFTAIEDGRILVVGGILLTSKGTGHCWTMVSKYAPSAGLRVFRVVKRQLEAMMQDLRLHRVETSNLEDAAEHHKWCRLLGFREEGLMWQYDDQKRNYIRFAKIM